MTGTVGNTTFERDLVSCVRSVHDVATVVLDRPKANALSLELVAQIREVFDYLHDDLPSAVVVWGGERVFSAGADIGEMGGASEARVATSAFRAAYEAVERLPRMVIAAINGYALGGGFELALACDFRVAGDGAKVGLPEIHLGLLPGAGGTQRLPRLAGHSVAKELIVTGRTVGANEALRLGIVDRVAADDDVLRSAQTWATEFAIGPQKAQGVAKDLLAFAADNALGDGLDREARLVADLFDSADAQSGIRSFLQRGPGKAEFNGT